MSAHAPALAKPTTPAAPAPALDDGAPLSTTISLSAGGSAAAAATDPECALPAQEEAGAGAGGVKVAGSLSESMDEQCDHVHYSHRAPWVSRAGQGRAGALGVCSAGRVHARIEVQEAGGPNELIPAHMFDLPAGLLAVVSLYAFSATCTLLQIIHVAGHPQGLSPCTACKHVSPAPAAARVCAGCE